MKYLICNLKAHKTYDEIIKYREHFINIKSEKINLILAPSNIYLPLFKNDSINLAVQDISLNESLSLTGDISIEQLKSLNIQYAIIGHFERRKYYKETEYEILKKIQSALKNNIKVIYCIGETAEERERKVEYQVLEKQIARVFNKLDNKDLENIIIAYEPTYLIGNNTAYDILKIRSMIIFIKKIMQDYYQIDSKVIFGGNVNIENINSLAKLNVLDGFIVCSAILNPENISIIVNQITAP